MIARAEIVARALSHLGHRETGPNDSPLIREWLERCGCAQGLAWCAAFASWCVEEFTPSGPGGIAVPVACAGAVALGRMFPATKDPDPGDLMWFYTGRGHGHVGIVLATHEDQALCIEGNSANSVRLVRRYRNEVNFSRTRPPFNATLPHPSLAPGAWDAPLLHVMREGTL